MISQGTTPAKAVTSHGTGIAGVACYPHRSDGGEGLLPESVLSDLLASPFWERVRPALLTQRAWTIVIEPRARASAAGFAASSRDAAIGQRASFPLSTCVICLTRRNSTSALLVSESQVTMRSLISQCTTPAEAILATPTGREGHLPESELSDDRDGAWDTVAHTPVS